MEPEGIEQYYIEETQQSRTKQAGPLGLTADSIIPRQRRTGSSASSASIRWSCCF